jgi:tyrosyl-tRNA synthetase
MHIGNLVQLMTLRRLQQAGTAHPADGRRHHQGRRSVRQGRHQADPDAEQIEDNKQSMLTGVSTCSEVRRRPDGRHHGRQCEWLDKLEYIPFLREVGGISRSIAC